MNWSKLNIFKHHNKKMGGKQDRIELIVQKYPKSIIAEQFRTIRTNLASYQNRCLLITSDASSEGKSTVSANLAIAWAKEGKQVCLVDCDMRKPTVAKTFHMDNKYGLSKFLSTSSTSLLMSLDMATVVQPTKIKGLSVVTSGPIPQNPSELVANNRMNELLHSLKNDFDIVIMDAPPVNPVSDTSILASKADGVIMVIPQNVAKKISVQAAINQLKKVHAHILGAVMNHVSDDITDNYYYYYY